MARFLWWALGACAWAIGFSALAWLTGGGTGRALRGHGRSSGGQSGWLDHARDAGRFLEAALLGMLAGGRPALLVLLGATGVVLALRARSRRARSYTRVQIDPYRGDHLEVEALVRMFEALHARLARPACSRLLRGQPSASLEVHFERACGAPRGWLAMSAPAGLERALTSALRAAYPNCRVQALERHVDLPAALLRLKKRAVFIRRAKSYDRFEHTREPSVNRLLTVMATCEPSSIVQLALTPAPALLEAFARRAHRAGETRHERRHRASGAVRVTRSWAEESELRGGMDLLHVPLFFLELRVLAASTADCRRIACELEVPRAENRLVARAAPLWRVFGGRYRRRVQRGEGNVLPRLRRGVFGPGELASLWQLPSGDYSFVPVARSGVPIAPAPPGVERPGEGPGTLRDDYGPVTIAPSLRKQNTAVPGAVEQGKTSYLIATVAEDLRRERCAVIVLDPKGDAADAAISLVPATRACTLLELANPTCGFNPLAVEAPADVIADYVVGALSNLFSDVEIRASSDRYLRNAIIAVLAYDRRSSLWDAARLLSVGEDGYAYRRRVASALRTLPEFSEISSFFTAELGAQLADARSVTTAKLDAPVNKLARLLNSTSIKRVLLNDSLRIDFDSVIGNAEVLVVKGALGAMGAGNTSVLMQLLVGMLDAALARQQDLVPAPQRVAVALKIDEAPLVLNQGFTETMALKRSAGLETVACWQADAQWVEREVRDQLDALFAHRVYFATASVADARAAASLTMSEFTDSVRPGLGRLSSLGQPDVRLHLPKHHAIATWSTAGGRQAAFIAETVPMRVDRARLALHAARQRDRGARPLTDLRRPHWDSGLKEEEAAGRVAPPQKPESCAAPQLPARAAASYRELVEIDRAHGVRWARSPAIPAELDPDPVDLEVLALLACFGHLLSSQIHRAVNPARSATTTQRRLKRLADAGLVERCQFHRRDGGGAPMCYALAAPAARLLGALEDRGEVALGSVAGAPPAGTKRSADGARVLRAARRELHVAGWALALMRVLGLRATAAIGREQAVISPPRRSARDGPAQIGPGDLRLPGGRVPHEFLRSGPSGRRAEVEHFETVRPSAIVRAPSIDLLVELQDRAPGGELVAKLERYDHFLAGWSLHTLRYGSRAEAAVEVVFVCRDRARAQECARRADGVLCAARAAAGEYPAAWEYPGRERISFASERDVHEGLRHCYGVPALPPPVRAAAAAEDPRARGAVSVNREILASVAAAAD